MAKAYWVNAFRAVRDAEALMAYAKLAGPAMQAAGGRFLARGMPAQVYEHGVAQRQEALRVLGDAAERDLRIVPGVA